MTQAYLIIADDRDEDSGSSTTIAVGLNYDQMSMLYTKLRQVVGPKGVYGRSFPPGLQPEFKANLEALCPGAGSFNLNEVDFYFETHTLYEGAPA